ncbi:helix-turn-helix transcriptional regulator [Frondihabitans sp. 762G35]|uniref:helix-turn-helix transcriptional regulator n=1 Tax=Frondihabitans sp. 762G35 TaxID=1446794 RepID=UPI000E706140|nr:helix-turn-helix transcriptional regulator [Frondihabitans sp. 762G35]
MDNKEDVREFLMSRRARLTPEQVGLAAGGRRRVEGLRRGEVATLAGVSVEYYARLERGMIAGASSSVLEAVARALQLTDPERSHLFDLARAADGDSLAARPRGRRTAHQVHRQSLQQVLSVITDGIAVVRDQRQNILATNALARAFYTSVIGDGSGIPNLARFQFLDPESRNFYPDWEMFAGMCVAVMRADAGRDPHDREMQDLVGELSTRSDTFRQLWGAHDVRSHGSGTKRFHHPEVGELILSYEELVITADPGLVLMVYTAEPGSTTAERLRLLASWNAPMHAPETAEGQESATR